MKNTAFPNWTESKFRSDNNLLSAGGPPHVSAGSWLTVTLLARALGPAVMANATGTFADIGCGKAPMLGLYEPRVDQVVTMDWPGSYHQGESINVSADLSDGLPLASSSVDSALLSDVLEHLYDPAECLREVARILQPGGVLIGSVPFLYGLHEEPHDYARYTSHFLRRALGDAGFEVQQCRPYGGSVDVIVDLAAKHSARAGKPGRWLAMALQQVWLRVRDGIVTERRMARPSEKFPLGYVFVARRGPTETFDQEPT